MAATDGLMAPTDLVDEEDEIQLETRGIEPRNCQTSTCHHPSLDLGIRLSLVAAKLGDDMIQVCPYVHKVSLLDLGPKCVRHEMHHSSYNKRQKVYRQD